MHQESFFLQCSASTKCTATHPMMQMYFAEVLQINILYSTENITFSPTHVCVRAQTHGTVSLIHVCMHKRMAQFLSYMYACTHTPNKRHFFHTHACTCACAHTHLLCPATCFYCWSTSWLAPNIDRWHMCWHRYIYTVWNQKLEWL